MKHDLKVVKNLTADNDDDNDDNDDDNDDVDDDHVYND